MPNLHVNHAPAMTAHLVRRKAFVDAPFIIVDVGARGGIEGLWRVLEDQIRVIGFEPDPTECARLNALDDKRVVYLPQALSRTGGPTKLYATRHAAATSFYPANVPAMARYLGSANLEIVSETVVETMTLSAVLAAHGTPTPDFIKLDAEGAELDILAGSRELIVSAGLLGVLSEVRFTRAMSDCPLFFEMEQFCRECGLELYDLDLYRHSKRSLPYPQLYDFRNETGDPYFGPTTQGQVLWGDALYFRDAEASRTPLSDSKIVKLACLFELFGLNDCAAELIVTRASAFADIAEPTDLLELLTPRTKGRKLTYREYMARYLRFDGLFRPTAPYRFPEKIIDDYDGTFLPAWVSRRFPWQWLRPGRKKKN